MRVGYGYDVLMLMTASIMVGGLPWPDYNQPKKFLVTRFDNLW